MMTATPMYNTAPEILFLLNLMILNDTKDEGKLLQNRNFFAADGSLLSSGHEVLQILCGRYVSYMRGENPASFPLRLTPPTAAGPVFFESDYPTLSISKKEDTVKMNSETKTILGYACKKGILQLKDGNSFIIYYATSITPSVKEFEYQFKDIPGFVLEYESQEQEGKKVKYVANKINLSPILANKFEIPVSGYRILN
jgi:hypothetical protein